MSRLSGNGFRIEERIAIYLETNGVFDALGKIIEHLDFISMDIKLPSTSGHSGLWEEHKLFIQGAARKNVL
jgi:pyruvate-formate lyase-activating enzyme